jgi:hypothetical protein
LVKLGNPFHFAIESAFVDVKCQNNNNKEENLNPFGAQRVVLLLKKWDNIYVHILLPFHTFSKHPTWYKAYKFILAWK